MKCSRCGQDAPEAAIVAVRDNDDPARPRPPRLSWCWSGDLGRWLAAGASVAVERDLCRGCIKATFHGPWSALERVEAG